MYGLSKNGLSINTKVSMRYRLDYNRVPLLHRDLGPDYVNVLLKPVLLSSVRERLGEMTPEQLYTDCSLKIQESIEKECHKKIDSFPIIIDSGDNGESPAAQNAECGY